ncbi:MULTISPECIES: DUF427 domain-containing protein [unclassified Rhizobium]|uniref:DUF427 domain-containing protein n=1 Tax=unclassified Rhizobium TaxID=2613769 RepID=UPI00214C44C6|nr:MULTISPECIES: DUF427 domain-containing protein [unclassified Rhizobium]
MLWKVQVSYYTLEVDGQKNVDAAWFYAEPKPAGKEIKPRGLLEKWEDRSLIHFSSRPRSSLLLKSRVGEATQLASKSLSS